MQKMRITAQCNHLSAFMRNPGSRFHSVVTAVMVQTDEHIIRQVANCIPNLEYLEKNIITNEQHYFFDVCFPDTSRSCKAPVAPNAIAAPRNFARVLLEQTPDDNFEGGEPVLASLRDKWRNDEHRPVRVVRSLPFVGYDETTGLYCYPTFGFHQGKELPVNDHGIIDIAGNGIKTSLANFKIERGQDFDPERFEDFLAVNGLNGLAILFWWTATYFVQQIGEQQISFSFLEFIGQPGARKASSPACS